jgi:hypothetical protein
MRTIEEIRNAIRSAFVGNSILRTAYGLVANKGFDEQFSAVSLETQLTGVSAQAIYDHEYLVESRAAEMEERIAEKIPSHFTSETGFFEIAPDEVTYQAWVVDETS